MAKPANVHAQLGGVVVEGPGPLLVATAAIATANTVTAANETTQTVIMQILNGLAWTVAKTAIQSLTQSIVNWINSGFEGSPAFVSDLDRNLSNLGDAVAEDFIRGLDQVVINNTGLSIRAPFQDQIARALREEFYRTTSSYGFDIRHPYTDCYGGRGFSLNGFFCQSQNPANNAIGRYQIARNELFKRIDGEAQNRIRELGWGKGFLSWRGPCGPNGTGAAAGASGGAHSLGGSAATVSLSQRDNTVGCPIRTPGAVIENTLGISVTSPFRQLELADSINEIVAALMSQLVNQALGGLGLSGVSQPSAGGGRSYLDQATDPSQYGTSANSLATGFAGEVDKQQRLVTEYQSAWQRIQSAAGSAEQACRLDSSKAQEARGVRQTADANVYRGGNAINALATIKSQITTAQSATTGDKATAVSNVVSCYQSLLSGGTSATPGCPASVRIPTPEEQAEAKNESRDTGSQDPGSLYSQMTRLATSCR